MKLSRRYVLKAMVVLALALMLGGCAAVNSFLCKPTDQQTLAANVGVALVQAALTAATVYTGNEIIAALSSQAKPVFDKVIAGYCATQAEWDKATTVLQQAQAQPDMAAKMLKAGQAKHVENPISFIGSVQWGK